MSDHHSHHHIDPDPDRLASATSDDLEAWVASDDPAIQAEALASPALTDGQLARLVAPDRPLVVRWAVATDRRPLAGLLAADDPDARIRAIVARRSDCPASLRDELLADPEVAALVG